MSLQKLEAIIIEIEAMLNDRPLTYVSSDISDPEPLTPAHLIYGRIQSVPHTLDDPDEVNDPTYLNEQDIKESSRQPLTADTEILEKRVPNSTLRISQIHWD